MLNLINQSIDWNNQWKPIKHHLARIRGSFATTRRQNSTPHHIGNADGRGQTIRLRLTLHRSLHAPTLILAATGHHRARTTPAHRTASTLAKTPSPHSIARVLLDKLRHQRRPGTAVAARQWTLIRQIVLMMMMQHATCTAPNPEGWNIPFHPAAGRRETGQGTRGWRIVIILVARHHTEIPAVERGPATAVANSRGQTTNSASASAAAAVGRRGQHRGHHFPPHRGPHIWAPVLRPGGRHHGTAAAAVSSHGGGRGSRPTQATGKIARKARGALADGALRRSVELLLQRCGAALRLERWRQQARTVVVHDEFQLAGVALRRVTAILDGRRGHVVQSHAVEAAVLRWGIEFVRRGSRMLLLLLLLLRNRVEGWRHNWHPLCCGTWRGNTENYGE